MTRIKLESISTTQNQLNAVFNVITDLPKARELEQKLRLSCDGTLSANQEWTASIDLDDFPPQSSPAAACDKLSEWLIALGNAVKGKNIQDLNLDIIAKTISVRDNE